MVFEVVAVAVWAMLPAYVPNNVAVLVGGGRPVDGGRSWRGRRLLGDGKTWRGTAGGLLAGVLLALVLGWIRPGVAAAIGIALPGFAPAAAVSLPGGAMLGDIGGSFAKRRAGRERGDPVPGIDQLDFVVGALGLTALAATGWFLRTFTAPVLVAVFLLTPILHVGTNVGAYLLGLKGEPW